MKQFDKIHRLKDVEGLRMDGLEITEKLDGSNGRFTMEGGVFRWGQRSPESLDFNIMSKPYNHIYKKIFETYMAISDARRDMVDEILNEIVIFGEVCGRLNRHKLDYPWDLEFKVFNGWDKKEFKYVSFMDPRVNIVIEELQLGRVKLLDIKDYNGATDWALKQDARAIEGFVAKDYENQLMVKFYVPGNEEIESAKFVKHRGAECYGESKFLHRYVTKARIEKILMKITEGQEKGNFMKYTAPMLKALWVDMLYECLPEFLSEERVWRDVPAMKNAEGQDIAPYKEEVFDIGYIRKHMPVIAVGIMKEIASDGSK